MTLWTYEADDMEWPVLRDEGERARAALGREENRDDD